MSAADASGSASADASGSASADAGGSAPLSEGEANASTLPVPLALLFCSAPPDQADALARALVEEGLCACVSVLPSAVSHYRWKGELERSEESLLLLKTRRDRVPALRERLAALHPYELPELLGLAPDPALSSEAYQAWVAQESRGA